MKLPENRDFLFYQRRKHDKWREVPSPTPPLEVPVADSHAHLHMLPDPAWELARAAANGVNLVNMVTDPSEDGPRPFDDLETWRSTAATHLEHAARREHIASPTSEHRPAPGAPSAERPPTFPTVPDTPITVGVHPHNAKLYDDRIENILLERLADPRVTTLGEIGLDYHYDLSPRSQQKVVFSRQIAIAKEHRIPIALHLRGGDDPERDNAHRDAFEILRDADALGPTTLLHCCTLPPAELTPWIEADCLIAYGGAITFKNADAAREGARLVPENRLLIETDSPYMTPEPMRGAACTPAHVIYTAAALAALRDHPPGPARTRFLTRLQSNWNTFVGN